MAAPPSHAGPRCPGSGYGRKCLRRALPRPTLCSPACCCCEAAGASGLGAHGAARRAGQAATEVMPHPPGAEADADNRVLFVPPHGPVRLRPPQRLRSACSLLAH